MQSAPSAHQPRKNYRHEMRTLTYVTLDEGNGGIIRNLSHEGVAVQAVGRLQKEQRVRLRFELRFPRLRVEARGRVSWTNGSGQCGIRFVEMPAEARREIDEWIFSNLLDSVAREAATPNSIFGSVVSIVPEENDGLILSAEPRQSIKLRPVAVGSEEAMFRQQRTEDSAGTFHHAGSQLNWLSRPLSANTLAWLVDSLVLIAGLLLFALIFLSIAHELPQWQITLSGALAVAVFVAEAYWGLFAVFGGPSLGVRLARGATGLKSEEEGDGRGRFR